MTAAPDLRPLLADSIAFARARRRLAALIEGVEQEHAERDAAGHEDGFLAAHARELRGLRDDLDRFAAGVRRMGV